MRNLFDQYSQPENRLTHALAVCLNEDRRLLAAFLDWLDITPPRGARSLTVVEQRLPGEDVAYAVEVEDTRKGLPDIVIHDDHDWCVLVESKIEASLHDDQLDRHERTLRRREFDRITKVVLTKSGKTAPRGTTARTWSGLYEWLSKAGGDWATRLRSYLRVAELRLAHDEYLTEGTLTMFDGFQFSDSNPYTYGEAKRLLKLALGELRRDRRLLRIGMDPKAPSRPAITGRASTSVWDYLQLRDRPKRAAAQKYLHLTLSVHGNHLAVAVTIPNAVTAAVRRRLAALGPARLVAMNRQIVQEARPLLKRGASVHASALQRHYRSQNSEATVDANLKFKLQTTLPRGEKRVKARQEWIGAFASLLGRRKANIQFQYRIELPWGTKGLDSRKSLDLIVRAWLVFKPLLRAARTS